MCVCVYGGWGDVYNSVEQKERNLVVYVSFRFSNCLAGIAVMLSCIATKGGNEEKMSSR